MYLRSLIFLLVSVSAQPHTTSTTPLPDDEYIELTDTDPATTGATFCPNSFIHFGKHCYSLVKDLKAPWVTANTVCELLAPGGTLLTMDHQSEMYAITGYLMGRNENCDDLGLVWTGGITDMKENSSEFVWATGNPVSSSNWADGASKSSAMNNTHRGIAMDCRRQYKWEAQGIEESHHFMCQSPPLQLSDGENLEDSVIVPVAEPECKVSRGRSPRPRKDFDCPPPFFRLGYSCYLFHRGIGKKTWTDSQRFCKRLAPYGKLAEFETFAEYYTMMQYLIKDGDCEKWKSTDEDGQDTINWYEYAPWIGARENGTTHQFYWESSGEPMTLDNWSSDQPNDNTADDGLYLGCNRHYELLDHPHSKKKPFICEADPREDTM